MWQIFQFIFVKFFGTSPVISADQMSPKKNTATKKHTHIQNRSKHLQ